jgi:nitric oxide reductase subunit B
MLTSKKNNTVHFFLLAALGSLLIGIVFGTIAAFQFLYPEFFSNLPFYKTRPLHVTSVVGWIFLASCGCVYYFLKESYSEIKISQSLSKIHLGLFVFGGLALLASFVMGKFGGREYWEGHPYFSVLIVITWLFFLVNFFRAVLTIKQNWPVYLWMWTTGVVFFLFTFIESNLWQIPYFGNNVVRDLTVQWKSYGALVGSWNMLVYGIATYLVEKISKDENIGKSKIAFYMYFLGFFNLLFGWAHHIYNVPCSPIIRIISYAVSMTELIILFKIIYNAKKSVDHSKGLMKNIPYWFLISSDIWIFLNLTMALAISIPAINLYTHGTHVTVAHAMGSTIGINTFILLGAVSYVFIKKSETISSAVQKQYKIGIIIFNLSLLVFWVALIGAGIVKGYNVIENKMNHYQVSSLIEPYLLVFALAGIGICIGLVIIVRAIFKTYKTANKID